MQCLEDSDLTFKDSVMVIKNSDSKGNDSDLDWVELTPAPVFMHHLIFMNLFLFLSLTRPGSVHNSVAASKVEQALSEVASSSSYLIKSGSPQINRIQGQIWLMTGD